MQRSALKRRIIAGIIAAGVAVGVALVPAAVANAVGKASIIGTLRVGSTLSVKLPHFSATPSAIDYEWSVNRGGTIVDPVSLNPTYVPVAEDLGGTVHVLVHATVNASPVTLTASVHPVHRGLFHSPRIVLGGFRDVGEILSATVNTSPSPDTMHYTWKKDGHTIAGEIGSTYLMRTSDYRHRIDLWLTISLPGFVTQTLKTHTATRTGHPRLAQPTTAPSISPQTPDVGATETADPGVWAPGVTFSYQWYAETHRISGAIHSTYTVSSSYFGKTLSVVVTGHKSGFTAVPVGSASSLAVDLGNFTAPYPTITGNNTLNSILTGHRGTWHPSATHYTYQWYLGVNPIPGATHSTYQVTSYDVGHSLYFRVFGTRPFYNEGSPTSLGFAIN